MTIAQQNQFKAISAEFEILATNKDAKFDICTFWPIAKTVLLELQKIAPFPLNLLVQALIGFGDSQCGDK